jgi:phage head maturation protease
MTEQLVTAQLEDAVELLEAAQGEDRRTIRLRLLRYGEVGQLETGPEVLEAGAFAGTDPSRVTIEAGRHGGPLVGVGTALEELDGVPYLDARVSRTRDGDELLELARDGVLRSASIVYRPMPGASSRRADGTNVRRRVELVRVAVLERGAFPSAEVVAAAHAQEVLTVTDPTPAPELTLEAITAAVRGVVADAIPTPVVHVPAPLAAAAAPTLPGSWGEYLEAALDGDTELVAAVNRAMLEAAAPTAIVDGVTGDVPSIVRPAWLSDIIAILPTTMPVRSAFGTQPLPDSGLEIDWPTFDGDFTARVGPQAAQKDMLISKKVTLGSDKASIVTIGGALDLSWQAIRRSSPSYRDAVGRILAIAWAIEAEKAFAAAVVSKATGTVGTGATPDGAKYHAAMIEAAGKVDDATGSPATFVLAAPDAWLAIAKATGLYPRPYGTSNAYGTAQASPLSVNVSGLEVTRAKSLAAGTVLVSHSSAATCYSSGMMSGAQDVLVRLGTDVAVWSMDAAAVFLPLGIVKVTTP